MSFILDALRRADAERQRDRGPDLHQVADGTGHRLPGPLPGQRQRHALAWGGGALGLVAVAALAWWLVRSPMPAAPTAPSVPSVAAAPPPQWATSLPPPTAVDPPPPPAPAPGVTQVQPVTSPAIAAPATTAGPASASSPMAPTGPGGAAAPAPGPAATGTASSVVTTNAASPAPTAPPASAPPPTVLQGAGALPEPWRSRVAALHFSGGVHSAERSQSFVLLGAALVHEGDTVAPEIAVDRIGPRWLRLRAGPHLVDLPL